VPAADHEPELRRRRDARGQGTAARGDARRGPGHVEASRGARRHRGALLHELHQPVGVMADPTLPPEGGAAAPASATAEGARPVDVSEEEVDALLAEGHAAGNIRPDVPRPYSLAAGAAARHRAPVLDRIHEQWIGAL